MNNEKYKYARQLFIFYKHYSFFIVPCSLFTAQSAYLAGAAGIEPASKVLETPILPLNYAPASKSTSLPLLQINLQSAQQRFINQYCHKIYIKSRIDKCLTNKTNYVNI